MIWYICTLVFFPSCVRALIEEEVTPHKLQKCYETNPKAETVHGVQNNCLQQYLSTLYRNVTSIGLDQNALNWIDSLGKDIHIRHKRQTRSGRYKLLERKEIRTLSENEKENFFDAVNLLKHDTSQKPNKYDAFALLHQGVVINSAHDGPNFPSWHRYVLVLFEKALRTKIPSVTLPYWDSTLDFRMTDPTKTILFSEMFLGNGQGVVFNGPFALWRTPAQNTYLRRDIPGPDSSLIDPVKLQNVYRKKYHRDILVPTATDIDSNMEYHHDGVHRWVGGRDGHMNDLNLAPQDPVFWLHHCFVDYIWEEFRKLQKKRGVDSETDYPATTDEFHAPNRLMDFLKPPKTNIQGYSNSFTKNIYYYAPAPTCKNACGGYNQFIYCKRVKRKKFCVSRSRREFINLDGFTKSKYWYPKGVGKQLLAPLLKARSGVSFSEIPPINLRAASAPTIGRQFRSRIVDQRTRSRKRRSLGVIFGDKSGFNINLITKNIFQNESCWSYTPYNINWAATPITIINERHRSEKNGDRTPVHLAVDNNNQKQTFNITVQADGFSYIGRHRNSVVIDKRTLDSKTMALVAFEKPSILGESTAYVTVHDSYGGVCRPTCLVSNTIGPSHMSTYRDCSGVIKITPDYPLMYMDTSHPDADTQPFLKFHCHN